MNPADLVRAALLAQMEALERACEEAIQGGEHGVLLVRHRDGAISVGVHPSVPYGYIYEMSAPL